MSRRKKSKHKKSLFLPVILAFVVICVLSFFIFLKLGANDSKSFASKNTDSNTTNVDSPSNNSVNNTNDTKMEEPNDTANGSSNVTSKNTNTSTNTSTSASSTSRTNYVVELPSNTEASKGNEVTVEKATELLKDKISSENSKITFSYDHTQNKTGTNYYVFQAFNSTGISSSGGAQSDTLGWYYVNVNNGSMFTYDVNSDVLTPLK